MLDTIVINLQRDAFIIHEPDRFTPNTNSLIRVKASKSIMKSIYNPSKQEQLENGYMPYLTLFRKPYGYNAGAIWLRVEFSASKLMFGNNFEELRDCDFKSVINALVLALEKMGVQVKRKTIISAKVSEIHYSKNCVLDRFTPCHMIIRMLEKADMSSRMDLSQSDFRNGGQMAKYHTSTYEIAIYDKVKDLEQARKYGEKRGAEKNYRCQLDLFLDQNPPEILRLEIRLKTKKIKTLFIKLGLDNDGTLKSLFSSALSQIILEYYWHEIKNALYLTSIHSQDREKLLSNIHHQFPKKRPTSVVALAGFVILCKDLGVSATRSALKLNNAQFYRLKADAKKLEQDERCPHFIAIKNIQHQLAVYTPLTASEIAVNGRGGLAKVKR